MKDLDKYAIKSKSDKEYIPTIGIECHVQFNTKTKLFTSVDNDARTAPPNTLISPLCMGLPGVLPVLNKEAVRLGIRAGIVLNAEVNLYSKFDRKHYFYPDSPLGYQITQFDERIIGEGYVDIMVGDEEVRIEIEGAHLEADAGKSTHPAGLDYSLVDLNRAGTPLLEIVTKPDIHSAIEAKAYAKELQYLMKLAGVSEADLFYGNMRFDVNVSVAPKDLKELGTRAEVKNLNSFVSVEKAADFEIKRQIKLLEQGEEIVQETRGWDDDKESTFSQRGKEDAHDYRYFPEPNIPPIVLTKEQIEDERKTMPEDLRSDLLAILKDKTKVDTLTNNPKLLEIALDILKSKSKHALKIFNWLIADVLGMVKNEDALNEIKITAANFEDLANMVDEAKLSSSGAKKAIEILVNQADDAAKVAGEHNLIQSSDTSEIEAIVQQVIDSNPKAAAQIKAGEEKAIGFLVGQVMKESKGQANPQMANEAIRRLID